MRIANPVQVIISNMVALMMMMMMVMMMVVMMVMMMVLMMVMMEGDADRFLTQLRRHRSTHGLNDSDHYPARAPSNRQIIFIINYSS